jgi:hypothetical protein
MSKNQQLQLIEEQARWIKKQSDNNEISLNYNDYLNEKEQINMIGKKFDNIRDYKTGLTFSSLPYEVELIKKDSILGEKRKDWHNYLSKDVYIEEAVHVLEDLQINHLKNKGLYFARKYKAGVEQFEVHRRVNPNDVENAAWHFLCVAKAESFDKAKSVVLPAPNDPRAPMEEVLQMLSTGETDKVIKKMESFPTNTRGRESADFYGNFYLGLYADAAGDRATAKRYMDLSAKDASFSYMGDVARVYAAYLSTDK